MFDRFGDRAQRIQSLYPGHRLPSPIAAAIAGPNGLDAVCEPVIGCRRVRGFTQKVWNLVKGGVPSC